MTTQTHGGARSGQSGLRNLWRRPILSVIVTYAIGPPEGVWIEIPGEGEIDLKSIHLSRSGTIQTVPLRTSGLTNC